MEIRIAAEDAKIGFVFVKRGLSPEACSTFSFLELLALVKLLNGSTQAEFGKQKRFISSQHLLIYKEKTCGFFTSIVPKSQVMENALKIAREIIQNAPVSVSTAKRLLWRGISSTTPLEAHLGLFVNFWLIESGE